MASTESVWKVVAVIAVFVMYMSLSSKITNLQNELNNTRNSLSGEIDTLRSQLYEMQETAKNPVKDGEYFEIYVTGVDEYGYVHEQYVAGWSTDEMARNLRVRQEQRVLHQD